MSSAPSSRALASLASEPAVAITRAPVAFAIWIAALPTPLPAARIRHRFGGLELRAGDQHVPGGERNERKRGGFFEAEICGDRDAR